MTEQTLNKHEIRTKETRQLLMRAAQEVFVRDGYAGADLGEIASLAGRTKGAIYAQFKSKEDIFMALVEEYASRYRGEMVQALASSNNMEQNREAFRKLVTKMSTDRCWNILMLEFKLFAIRNPQAKTRFQDFRQQFALPDQEKRLTKLLGPNTKQNKAVSRSAAIQLLQPILSAITLESIFDPSVVNGEVTKRVAGRIFDFLFETPSPE